MKNKILTLFVGLFLVASIASVYAADASTPYSVTMNFVVGEDTTFSVALAGAETSIDFNPADANSKEVEPDSQNAAGTTPMVNITNDGNVALNFTHQLNQTKPSHVEVSWSLTNSVDWSQTVTTTYSVINSSVPAGESEVVYYWANFTAAPQGTTQRLYYINTTAA